MGFGDVKVNNRILYIYIHTFFQTELKHFIII